jgi:hypothetical protein
MHSIQLLNILFCIFKLSQSYNIIKIMTLEYISDRRVTVFQNVISWSRCPQVHWLQLLQSCKLLVLQESFDDHPRFLLIFCNVVVCCNAIHVACPLSGTHKLALLNKLNIGRQSALWKWRLPRHVLAVHIYSARLFLKIEYYSMFTSKLVAALVSALAPVAHLQN